MQREKNRKAKSFGNELIVQNIVKPDKNHTEISTHKSGRPVN